MKTHGLRSRIRTGLLASAVLAGMGAMSFSARAETITVWSGYPELVPFFQHVADGMKAKFPDLTVKISAITLREHEKRVALELSSDNEDALVFDLDSGGAARYLENGLVSKAPADIAEFINAPGNFIPFFADSVKYDGDVYGMPLFNSQVALFYNLDKFAAAGLKGPPKTMDEYTEYAEKLTERDGSGNPVVSGWSLRLAGGGQGIAEKFWNNLHQFGGALLEKSGDGWVANFANEKGEKALKQYLDLIHKYKTVTQQMPADAEAFERGQTAMFMRESWVIGDIAEKAPDLHYATAPLPRGAIAVPENLYVRGKGSDERAAWEYAKAANDPENALWLLENVGWLPVRQNVDYGPVIKKIPGFSGFLDLPKDYSLFSLPPIEPIAEILARMAATLTDVFGSTSEFSDEQIRATLQKMQDDANATLDRAGILAK